ncbi:unnamed protein product [Calypogeia fissa]
MKTDVGIEEQEKDEGYGVSGGVTTSTMTNSNDKATVRTNPSATLEYEFIEQSEQNIRAAGCDADGPQTTPHSDDSTNTPMDTEEHPSGGSLSREETPSSLVLPPPPPPPPALPPLPPEWKEAFDPAGTGQKYYYNVRTHETRWERPRPSEITPEKDAEPEISSTRSENGALSDALPIPTSSLPDEDEETKPNEDEEMKPNEDEEMKPNVAINETDSEQFAKIQQKNDNQSVKKMALKLFKSGVDHTVTKMALKLFKFGSGDQTGSNNFSPPRAPLAMELNSTPTNTTPISVEDQLNTANGCTEEKEVMELVKKVPIFELLEDHVLHAICNRLTLEQYLESTKVFQVKEPIDQMLFLVRGNLECRGEDGSISHLKDGDFCGEELLFRYTATAGVTTTSKKNHQGKHPLSRRTIECMTHVEAFSLDSEALEYITTNYKASFASHDVQGAVRYFSQYGWSLAATYKQNSRTSNREQPGQAASHDATSKVDDSSTKHKEQIDEHDNKVYNLQIVPYSQDFTDTVNSSSQVGDEDEVLTIDAPLLEDTPNSIPSPSRSSDSGKKQREGVKKTWWRPFKSDGDQYTGRKLIKRKEKTADVQKNDTSGSILVPSTSNSSKPEHENDSNAGKKMTITRWRPFKPAGGHQEGKKIGWRFKFKSSSGNHSASTLEMIKKVPIFELLEGHILEAICDRLSLWQYSKSSEVLRKGEPVNHMLFIVRGKLKCLGEDGSILQFEEGDFCGEELLSWCTDRVGVSTFKKIDHHGRHPLSSKTVNCLTIVVAFSLDLQALEYITTQFKFAFRSPFVQGPVRYFSLDWRSLAATRIQKTWRSGKRTIAAAQATRIQKTWRSGNRSIGAGQAHLTHDPEHKSNDSNHKNSEHGDIALGQDTVQENSSSEIEETAFSFPTEPSRFETCHQYELAEKEDSIGDNGDDVSITAKHPPEVLSDTANSAPTKSPSEVLSDTANSATPLVAEDEITDGNQEEADTSNSGQGTSTLEPGKTERQDDDHSTKKTWWLPFKVTGDHAEKKNRPKSVRTIGLSVQLDGSMPRRYTYKQLKTATGGFSEESKIGQGGFGTVYRGVLPSTGIPVAVKKMDGYSQNQGVKEFLAEVSIINKLRHRNLIQLLGWCDDAAKKKYVLVYELMPNGCLEEALFGQAKNGTNCLSWPQRFNILTGTASGLEYLHLGLNQQVIHRDIKCSNIMLDHEWNAKLGDFGLARLVDHHRVAATTNVAGTMGYIAPEVIAEGRFTEKADVFGFGVVALEVVCGRRVYQAYADEFGLVDFVWHGLSEGDLLTTVDERLNNEYDEYWAKVVLMVGLLCTHPDPRARPSMRRVVQILAGDVLVPSIPASKPTAIFCSLPQISITDLQDGKAGSNSRSGSGSTLQLSTTSPSASSSNSNSSIGITRSST